jgi:hypothetical protein
MNIRRLRISMSDKAKQALDDVGAEPLAGSGFEDETPDRDFGEDVASVCSPQAAG